MFAYLHILVIAKIYEKQLVNLIYELPPFLAKIDAS